MKPADAQLAEVLARTPMHSPRIPVYSNVDAAPHSDPDDIRRTLVAQVLQGVRWEDSMRRMLADGFDTFYEIGPGRVLTGLLKRIDRKIAVHERPGAVGGSVLPAGFEEVEAGRCPIVRSSSHALRPGRRHRPVPE